MDGLFAARVLHVLAVVFWIDGMAMVTAVLLPAVRRLGTPEERIIFFEEVERGFAAQSRVTTLIVATSGSYLVYRLDLWERVSHLEYWWMHAMVAVWSIFTLILFVLEPLFPHRRLVERARRAPDSTFRLMTRFRWVLLMLSLITVAGAVAGSHGYLLFS